MKISKMFSWLAVQVSSLTMVISPLAQGAQAERNATMNYKQLITEVGLNKPITAKEFFEKNKHLFPGYAYYDVEAAVKANPNALMPQFTVKTSKMSDGSEIPVLTFIENGKMHNIQVYGEKDKFLKFDNTVVNEAQAMQPEVLFQKLLDDDKKLATTYSSEIAKVDVIKLLGGSKTNSSFSQNRRVASNPVSEVLSTMNQEKWKALTPEQRAGLLVQLRLMYQEAIKVKFYNTANSGKKQKTSQFPVLEKLFAQFFKKASADPAAEAVIYDDKAPDSEGLTHFNQSYNANSSQCISFGYVGVYVKNLNGSGRPGCSAVAGIDKNYKSDVRKKYVLKEINSCGSQSIACNPIVYGYDRSTAKPICVNIKDSGAQVATHFEGPCDTASRLGTKSSVDTSDYSKLPSRDEQKKAVLASQTSDFSETKAFLDSVLKHDGNSDLAKLLKDGVWDQKLVDELNRINEIFAEEIDNSVKICEGLFPNEMDMSSTLPSRSKGIKKPLQNKKNKVHKTTALMSVLMNEAHAQNATGKVVHYDKNQRGACDQLHRRWIATQELINSLQCPAGYTAVKNDKQQIVRCDKAGGVNTPEGDACKDYAMIKDQVETVGGSCVCKTTQKAPVEKDGNLSCDGEAVVDPVVENQCPEDISKKVTLKNKSTLDADCKCVNKKGEVYGYPTEDQPGLLKKIFNSKANRDYKKQTTIDFVDKQSHENSRAYVCKNGPNWWAIAGIGLGVAGLLALVFAKTKTKTVTKTETVTNTIDNTFTCTAPKYPVVISESPKKYECICAPCGKYYLANGTAVDIVPNPVTCACNPPPGEGGNGDGGGDSGGVPGAGTGQ